MEKSLKNFLKLIREMFWNKFRASEGNSNKFTTFFEPKMLLNQEFLHKSQVRIGFFLIPGHREGEGSFRNS